MTLKLIPELAKLEPSAQERHLARQTLLKYLADPAINYYSHAETQGHLVGLSPTIEDLTAWRAWTFPPTNALLTAVRGNSPLGDWIKVLQSQGRATGPEVIRPDNGGFQHYVNNSARQEAVLSVQPVTALCGWTWIPSSWVPTEGGTDDLPVCPNCRTAYDLATRSD
jgi:hypothetical protein